MTMHFTESRATLMDSQAARGRPRTTSSSSKPENDMENERLSLFKMVCSSSNITRRVLEHPYKGSGTRDDPYKVEWIPDDPRNPFLMPISQKWIILIIETIALFSVSFASSALSSANPQIEKAFNTSPGLTIADTSLFVLAFGVGPLLWAPLSELYGRQIFFFIAFLGCTLFSGVTIASKNIATILVLRFLAGTCGALAISNSGGVVSDLFIARERGIGMLVFIGPAFLGPTVAPIACNYLAVAAGWRWVQALTTIIVAVGFVLGTSFVPETYHPVLLRRRAAELTQMTDKCYVSALETASEKQAAGRVFRNAMIRPWALLVHEPIVLSISLYMALIYGTLYMEFAAFPIVFEEARHWSQANSGLAFIGMGVGQILGMLYTAADNKRYQRIVDAAEDGTAPAEARLLPSMIASIILPTGLFLFAWTNFPSIHWIFPQIGTLFLGFSHVLIFLSAANYLADTYTVYAASAFAANTVVRALVGAAFPLFTNSMYGKLGIHWGSSVPAFLALVCTPLPWLFYLYGPAIRRKCRYAAESATLANRLTSKAEEKKHEPIDIERSGTRNW